MKIIIGNIFLNCSLVILFEKLFKYAKIKKVEIQKINCGLGELTKKKVIGQAKTNNRNGFLFLNKGGIFCTGTRSLAQTHCPVQSLVQH